MRNQATAKSTTADIQKVVAQFLKGAPDRDGGRKARQNRIVQMAGILK